jgi:hypothetical protein
MLHNLIINNRYENKKTLMIQLEVETDLVGIQGDMRRYAISVVILAGKCNLMFGVNKEMQKIVENEHIPL